MIDYINEFDNSGIITLDKSTKRVVDLSCKMYNNIINIDYTNNENLEEVIANFEQTNLYYIGEVLLSGKLIEFVNNYKPSKDTARKYYEYFRNSSGIDNAMYLFMLHLIYDQRNFQSLRYLGDTFVEKFKRSHDDLFDFLKGININNRNIYILDAIKLYDSKDTHFIYTYNNIKKNYISDITHRFEYIGRQIYESQGKFDIFTNDKNLIRNIISYEPSATINEINGFDIDTYYHVSIARKSERISNKNKSESVYNTF